MKRAFHFLTMFVLVAFSVSAAETVPENLTSGYTLVAEFNPIRWKSDGYRLNNLETIKGEVKKVAYAVELTGKDGKSSWVWVAMDGWGNDFAAYGVPFPGQITQRLVNHLEVASNVPGVKTGKFERGNVEFGGGDYAPGNSKKVPGASDSSFDFGDHLLTNGSFGSFQVHNFAAKQTVFAFNSFGGGANCDLGIGNAPAGNPDWTFHCNGKNFSDAKIRIYVKADNLKAVEADDVAPLDGRQTLLTGRLRENKLDYAPGEPMTFVLEAVNRGQKATKPYFIVWKRTGDDGRIAEGKQEISLGPLVITTSLDRPGFVQIYATIQDGAGRQLMNGRNAVFFDGGAGVEIDKLTSLPEPADFDAFWAKQKDRLAAVPLNAEEKKVKETGDGTIYAVKIDCAGPRPVTGYLSVPTNAQPQSLPIHVVYFGYTSDQQRMPNSVPANKLAFWVNAHGFELGRDKAYYDNFARSIMSRGRGYAFDPEQNKDPNTAYFNGMTLRVMRSLEYIKTRSEWNRRDLTVSGGSQGGLQTIWAAGLDRDITAAYPDIPWCCDLGGVTRGRLTGGWRIQYVPGLDYYDPVNFAKRIKCSVTVGRAGLGDYVCPPSGVATFYNNLNCPKKIFWYQGSTHGYVPPEPRQIFVRESK